MNNNFEQNSRSGYRSKRKKTNLILNSLIVIVVLLIIFVGYHIFASGNDTASTPNKATVNSEQKQTASKKEKTQEAVSNETQNSDNSADDNNNQNSDESSTGQADQSQAVVSTGGSSPNVVKTTVNPAWRPLGTSQTGEHTPVYDTKSVDWQEMLNAMSYATGLDPSNMTVYWLGRDKSTSNASIGTVYSKDKQQVYRVYIKWVDGQGWMPTKVEELSQLER
ncbi:YrrS family protein [Bacillus sp. BRMEA1]|uniref:YrrS family protein n=1 Tax=Neobacillus endophyticus TaxID=2738405 RepID=UPI0015638EB8|nr:YrrS family protein [Neobacillus endophyticus]NRD75927.1 YrrS family protein [Neobacillus endophyticus]